MDIIIDPIKESKDPKKILTFDLIEDQSVDDSPESLIGSFLSTISTVLKIRYFFNLR